MKKTLKSNSWVLDAINNNIAFSPPIAKTCEVFINQYARNFLKTISVENKKNLEYLLNGCFMGAIAYLVHLQIKNKPLNIFKQITKKVTRDIAGNISYHLYSNLLNIDYKINKYQIVEVDISKNIEDIFIKNIIDREIVNCYVFPEYTNFVSKLLKNYNYDVLHECNDDLFYSPYPYPITDLGKIKLISIKYVDKVFNLISKKTSFEKGLLELVNYQKIINNLSYQNKTSNINISTINIIGFIVTNKFCYLLSVYNRNYPIEYNIIYNRKYIPYKKLLKYLYNNLIKYGIAWRDFSPRNIFIIDKKNQCYDIILCDFERNSFFNNNKLEDKWYTVISIFAHEEFINCLNKDVLSEIFIIDKNTLNQYIDIKFIESRRIELIIKTKYNIDLKNKIKIKYIFNAIKSCYSFAKPIIYDDIKYSLLYPFDILSNKIDTKKRLYIMNNIIHINNINKQKISKIMEKMAIITTILYYEDYKNKLCNSIKNNFNYKFCKLCTNILSIDNNKMMSNLDLINIYNINIYQDIWLPKILKNLGE